MGIIVGFEIITFSTSWNRPSPHFPCFRGAPSFTLPPETAKNRIRGYHAVFVRAILLGLGIEIGDVFLVVVDDFYIFLNSFDISA